jgi:hypothetical protein
MTRGILDTQGLGAMRAACEGRNMAQCSKMVVTVGSMRDAKEQRCHTSPECALVRSRDRTNQIPNNHQLEKFSAKPTTTRLVYYQLFMPHAQHIMARPSFLQPPSNPPSATPSCAPAGMCRHVPTINIVQPAVPGCHCQQAASHTIYIMLVPSGRAASLPQSAEWDTAPTVPLPCLYRVDEMLGYSAVPRMRTSQRKP